MTIRFYKGKKWLQVEHILKLMLSYQNAHWLSLNCVKTPNNSHNLPSYYLLPMIMEMGKTAGYFYQALK